VDDFVFLKETDTAKITTPEGSETAGTQGTRIPTWQRREIGVAGSMFLIERDEKNVRRKKAFLGLL
jgi:hypothetical protein